ncbi:Phosphoinositide phosphatase sac1 [Phlyctochytrium bullatum]|nr:Phosphoinositide phosphatase sac1 [Phlyctochytrium bullatum]
MSSKSTPVTWQTVVVLVNLSLSLLIMAFDLAPVDFTMFVTTFLFVPMGIISLREAVQGFANEGMLTVMVLFAVAAGIEKTGCLEVVRHLLTLGLKKKTDKAAIDQARKDDPEAANEKPKLSLPAILFRLTVPLGALSAFLNNTPIVAMFIPVLQDFSRSSGISPSKLMLPMSYGVILGGTCTLIGTSTNLVAFSLAEKSRPKEINNSTFGLFQIGVVGLPVFFVGILYTVFLADYFLPDRIAAEETFQNPRDYVVAVRVVTGSPIDGKTIGKAKLKQQLRGLKVAAVVSSNGTVRAQVPTSELTLDLNREQAKAIEAEGLVANEAVPEPTFDTVLEGGDLLLLVGRVDYLDNLKSIDGLVVVEDSSATINFRTLKTRNVLYEAVVSPKSALIGRTVREASFRTTHDVSVIAIHRDRADATRVHPHHETGLGNVVLHAGDVLLIIGTDKFQKEIEKEARENLSIKKALTAGVETEVTLDGTDAPVAGGHLFSLIAKIKTVQPPRLLYRAILAAAVAAAAIVVASSPTNISLLTTMVFAATIMVLAGCLTADEARNSLSWEVLITVAISFGLGQAMQNSGAADLVANALVKAAEPTGEVGLMTALYFVCVLLNAILTNNAAVAVLFPIVDAACKAKNYNFIPFLIVLMLAGSADFSTPIGYQCNLMVYAPGGYKFRDYLWFGIPLQIITGVVTIAVAATLKWWWVYAIVFGAANVVALVWLEGFAPLLASVFRKKSN